MFSAYAYPTAPGKAGKALRARLNAELRHAEEQEGHSLEWTPREVLVIDAPMEAADRAAELRQLWRAELTREEPRPSTLAKLAADDDDDDDEQPDRAAE